MAAAAMPVVPAAGGVDPVEVVVDHGEQRLDLLDLEHLRQAPRQPRRGDRAPRVAGHEPGPRAVPVERAEGGQALGDRGLARGRRSGRRGRRAGPSGPGARQSAPRSSIQARYAVTVVSYERRVLGEVSRASSERRKRRERVVGASLTPPRPRGRSRAPARRSRGGAPGPGPGARRSRPSRVDRRPRGPRVRPPPPRRRRAPAVRAPPGSAGRPGARSPASAPSGSGTSAPQVMHSPASPRATIAPLPSRVDVVDGARRLVVAGEVALRVVRAPPEDVPGAPGATRDEVPVARSWGR